MTATGRHDVIVIGAGLAGLCEARDRVAGRGWTSTFPDTDIPIELGGSWFTDGRLRDLLMHTSTQARRRLAQKTTPPTSIPASAATPNHAATGTADCPVSSVTASVWTAVLTYPALVGGVAPSPKPVGGKATTYEPEQRPVEYWSGAAFPVATRFPAWP